MVHTPESIAAFELHVKQVDALKAQGFIPQAWTFFNANLERGRLISAWRKTAELVGFDPEPLISQLQFTTLAQILSKELAEFEAQPTATVPNPPIMQQPTEITETSVVLHWTPRSDGGSPLISYKVTVAKSQGGFVLAAIDVGLVNSLQVSSLTPATSYNTVVQAVNAIGTSLVSDSLVFNTLSPTVEPPPPPEPEPTPIPTPEPTPEPTPIPTPEEPPTTVEPPSEPPSTQDPLPTFVPQVMILASFNITGTKLIGRVIYRPTETYDGSRIITIVQITEPAVPFINRAMTLTTQNEQTYSIEVGNVNQVKGQVLVWAEPFSSQIPLANFVNIDVTRQIVTQPTPGEPGAPVAGTSFGKIMAGLFIGGVALAAIGSRRKK